MNPKLSYSQHTLSALLIFVCAAIVLFAAAPVHSSRAAVAALEDAGSAEIDALELNAALQRVSRSLLQVPFPLLCLSQDCDFTGLQAQ